MATIRKGTKFVWGVTEPKPIHGLPEGRQRLRLRPRCEGRVRVRTTEGIREFNLKDCGDHWEPAYEVGRNFRPSTLNPQPYS